jgi:hypothetical protein
MLTASDGSTLAANHAFYHHATMHPVKVSDGLILPQKEMNLGVILRRVKGAELPKDGDSASKSSGSKGSTKGTASTSTTGKGV